MQICRSRRTLDARRVHIVGIDSGALVRFVRLIFCDAVRIQKRRFVSLLLVWSMRKVSHSRISLSLVMRSTVFKVVVSSQRESQHLVLSYGSPVTFVMLEFF